MACLALLTAIMILLRIFWMRAPAPLRWFLLRASVLAIVVHAIFAATKWGTTSAYINVIINWLAIAGYELLVLLFSRFQPRWLTSICAAILIIPLFAATIVMPLTGIFRPGTLKKTPIGKHLYYKISPWSNNGAGNSGVDLDIFYRPPFAPFLSHKVNSQAFNIMECNASSAFVVPGPDANSVIARCPHWTNQPPGTEDKLLQVKLR
jgi:hypothetical protein